MADLALIHANTHTGGWPRYKPLMRAIRHAIYIQPLEQELTLSMAEQIDEETRERLASSLRRNVDELQEQYDESMKAPPARIIDEE